MEAKLSRVLGVKIRTATAAKLDMINWPGKRVAVNRAAKFKVFGEFEEAMKRLGIENHDGEESTPA